MKKAILFGVLISVMLISCTKNTSAWLGTYNGTGSTNNINRVVITSASSTSVQMQLQTVILGTYYTYATVQNATLSNNTTASINENGLIAGYTDTYHFVGTAVLSGNSLTVSGSATSTTNSNDVKLYYFTGNK